MMTALPLPQSKGRYAETHLQAVLEGYLRGLRERVPSLLEVKGRLPANFWTQEEARLAGTLITAVFTEPQTREWAHRLISLIAPRVDVLLAMESSQEISLDMLRYELRIGPLSDARAERFANQQAAVTGKMGAF